MKSGMAAMPIFLAFFCMGFGDVVGPLTGLIKEEFHLSNTMAQLIPFMGFIMFGILSVPMGIYQDRTSKKRVLILGLLLALMGLVLPIVGQFSSFELLLMSILMLGAGATTLQVAGNPIMRDVSPEGKYSRNLSFGQFVKAIGSMSGALIPLAAVNFWDMDWKILFPVYSALIVLTLIILALVRIREKKEEGASPASVKSCFTLFAHHAFVRLMVVAIFVYVGAEVCMSTGMPIYLKDSFGIDIASLGVAGSGFFFLALMIGRFLGGLVLNWMKAGKFLVLTLILSVLGIVGLFVQDQVVAVISIFVIGLGFANIFPLIFSITVDSLPERANELSGLMVMAIVGGAAIPPLMGVVADYFSVMTGFLVPLAAIGYILFVSIKVAKR